MSAAPRLLVALVLIAGCAAEPPPAAPVSATAPEIAHEAPAPEVQFVPLAPAPDVAAEPLVPATNVAVATGDVFGTAPDPTRPLVPLAQLLADPSAFEQQLVRTEGDVAQVCQRMGCWMELRDGANGPPVRVPMAGHAFFLPRDAAGRRATVEGRVALRALSAAERTHLESEGASATASALALEATGVILHPR